MRAEDSAPVSSSKTSSVSVPAARANTRPEKILRVSLESASLDSTVVLHCHERYISRSDGRVLSSLIAEVLPSARRMIVDLSAVQSLDSGALGELVMIHMWAEAAGYALPFASPSDSLRGLFESTHLVSVFDVYASVDEAIVAMRQEQVQPA
ncbi:MAG: STAS domain-containing protein [Terriglobales bacterium]